MLKLALALALALALKDVLSLAFILSLHQTQNLGNCLSSFWRRFLRFPLDVKYLLTTPKVPRIGPIS